MARAAITKPDCGRGVLEGAFMLLDVLSRAENGLGLSALAREAGLAKTTAHRLAEQLVAIGAARRIEHRYLVGPLIARLGQSWQPDPQLRHAAYGPVRVLAVQARTAAAVYVMHDGRAHLVTAAVCPGRRWLPPGDLDVESLPRTAVAQVLLAATCEGGAKTASSAGPWPQLRSDLRDWRRFVTDDQDATEGIRWVAAPVRPTDRHCVAAVAALVAAPVLSPGLKDLVVYAARQISRQLQ